ncbi:MAG: L-ribulose-5-phosphate 4-epimerase [Oscillospiraceae bacterium]|nr:L-ribulose-5-phosphate 4-epimerase [Oscillospiraceae bacterium]
MKELKQRVLAANLMLPKYGLVTFTWGNVSEYDRETGLVAIKPSGVEYDTMTADDIVVLDLQGNIVDGRLRPSSDAPTHLELYRSFEGIGGIVHTHSRYATAFAQAGKDIPALGTTHGDYFYGDIPCTRSMTPEEIAGEYELETGKVIVECCKEYAHIPAALVRNHAPFVWGKDGMDAVHNSVVLEELSAMAWLTLSLDPAAQNMSRELLDKHYLRKHGANAYYGQK